MNAFFKSFELSFELRKLLAFQPARRVHMYRGIMERDASLQRFIAEIGWVYSNRAEWCEP